MNSKETELYAKKFHDNISRVILGKDEAIHAVITALFANGHVLLEDFPGNGKTVLAKCIAKSIDGNYKRIQFTPDLLPADITGINYYNVKTSEFEFLPGPVFTNILLADEINRATPKTQSGILECMEERQVSIEGQTYILDRPFMVIATQNPIDTQGVFPLPEAQLDRFLIRLSLGYPDFDSAVAILSNPDSSYLLERLSPVITGEKLSEIIDYCRSIRVSEDILKYIIKLTENTRKAEGVLLGISQRGSLALLSYAKANAAICGREYVIPDDVKAGALYVFPHRLIISNSERIRKETAEKKIQRILEQTPVPTEFLY